MAIESSPIYDLLTSEMGSPILNPAIDCSYAAVLKQAGPAPADAPAAAAVKAPSVLTPRKASKPLAPVGAKNAS